MVLFHPPIPPLPPFPFHPIPFHPTFHSISRLISYSISPYQLPLPFHSPSIPSSISSLFPICLQFLSPLPPLLSSIPPVHPIVSSPPFYSIPLPCHPTSIVSHPFPLPLPPLFHSISPSIPHNSIPSLMEKLELFPISPNSSTCTICTCYILVSAVTFHSIALHVTSILSTNIFMEKLHKRRRPAEMSSLNI